MAEVCNGKAVSWFGREFIPDTAIVGVSKTNIIIRKITTFLPSAQPQ